MDISQSDIDSLVAYCETHLGDPELWKTPEGYPESLALCIIDAIYSTGSHYTSVVNVVKKYKAIHGSHDGARGLLASIERAGGPRAWAVSEVGNQKPANTRLGAPLKAEVIQQAAQLLVDLGIDTVPDLVTQVAVSPFDTPVHTGWRRLPSQSSGVTYNYLLILAGLPSIKPDRMVLRFLAAALGADSELGTDKAVELLGQTATAMGVDPRVLDHIVWRAASGRELTD